LPTNYTYSNLCDGLGVRNDGSSNFINFDFVARECRFNQSVTILDGAGTASAWTAMATMATFFPSTAKIARILSGNSATGTQLGWSHRSDGHGGDYFMSAVAAAAAFGASMFTANTQVSMVSLYSIYASTMYYWSTNATLRFFAGGYKT
jgi:hypothetical protein